MSTFAQGGDNFILHEKLDSLMSYTDGLVGANMRCNQFMDNSATIGYQKISGRKSKHFSKLYKANFFTISSVIYYAIIEEFTSRLINSTLF